VKNAGWLPDRISDIENREFRSGRVRCWMFDLGYWEHRPIQHPKSNISPPVLDTRVSPPLFGS
jgi:hypothetical protein